MNKLNYKILGTIISFDISKLDKKFQIKIQKLIEENYEPLNFTNIIDIYVNFSYSETFNIASDYSQSKINVSIPKSKTSFGLLNNDVVLVTYLSLQVNFLKKNLPFLLMHGNLLYEKNRDLAVIIINEEGIRGKTILAMLLNNSSLTFIADEYAVLDSLNLRIMVPKQNFITLRTDYLKNLKSLHKLESASRVVSFNEMEFYKIISKIDVQDDLLPIKKIIFFILSSNKKIRKLSLKEFIKFAINSSLHQLTKYKIITKDNVLIQKTIKNHLKDIINKSEYYSIPELSYFDDMRNVNFIRKSLYE